MEQDERYTYDQQVARQAQVTTMREEGAFLGSLWLYNHPKEGSGIISPYEYSFDSGRTTALIAQWIVPGLMKREVDYQEGFGDFLENRRPEILMGIFTTMVGRGSLDLLSPGNETQLESIRASVAASYSHRNRL